MADQKSSEDWLPPGWAVEVRVRNNGKRDKCYTDPSKGLKFFSKPEVLRYLNSIEANHPKSEGKIRGSCNGSEINSPAVAEQISLSDSKTSGPITRNRSSKLAGVAMDEKIGESSAGREGTPMSSSTLAADATDLELRAKTYPTTGGAPTTMLPEDKIENPGSRKPQLGHNDSNRKKPELPRRASKRLAGIEIGPLPELKTNNRARRVSARRLNETEVSKAVKLEDSSAREECAERTHPEENNANEKPEEARVLPPENLSAPEKEHDNVQVETVNNKDEKPGSPLDFPLKDLWMDPCIEFAIKTLTGAIPIEDEISKANNNSRSSQELPFKNLWDDPCIEFAVKTLTGAIPVVDDLGVQDYLQQQFTSPETKGDKSSNFQNVNSHNGCGSDAFLQHFDAVNGDVSLQNSGDAALRPHCEERSEKCQR